MRVIAWNIRAGGGRRAVEIAEQLRVWQPDVVVLTEYRATEPSRTLAAHLRAWGLRFQTSTADAACPSVNAVLVASRYPVRTVRLKQAPVESHRWLPVKIAAPQALGVLAIHVPNRASGRKYPFLDAVANAARDWRGPPALVVGDSNSGRIAIDEEAPAFNAIEDRCMMRIEGLGVARRFQARPCAAPRVHLVLTQRQQRFPDRPGVPASAPGWSIDGRCAPLGWRGRGAS